MNDNRLIAALLTVAVNLKRPRASSRELGHEDWRHILEDYRQFLDYLDLESAEPK